MKRLMTCEEGMHVLTRNINYASRMEMGIKNEQKHKIVTQQFCSPVSDQQVQRFQPISSICFMHDVATVKCDISWKFKQFDDNN
jgi:hypothetical protein